MTLREEFVLLWEEIKLGKDGDLLPTFRQPLVMFYLDAIVSICSITLFSQLGWSDREIGKYLKGPYPFAVSMLCFLHVTVYWINFRHAVRFTEWFGLFQMWGFSLITMGLAVYPYTMIRWLEQSDNMDFFILNFLLSSVGLLLYRSLDFEPGNRAFRLYCTIAPYGAVTLYGTGICLKLLGVNPNILLWISPVLFMCPLGGEKPTRDQNKGNTHHHQHQDSFIIHQVNGEETADLHHHE